MLLSIADGPSGNGYTYPQECKLGADYDDKTGLVTFVLEKAGQSDQISVLNLNAIQEADKTLTAFTEVEGKNFIGSGRNTPELDLRGNTEFMSPVWTSPPVISKSIGFPCASAAM